MNIESKISEIETLIRLASSELSELKKEKDNIAPFRVNTYKGRCRVRSSKAFFNGTQKFVCSFKSYETAEKVAGILNDLFLDRENQNILK